MRMMKKIYLAYGSNLNIEQMKYRCPDAKKIGFSFIENYKLNFRGTRRGSGFANIERSKGSFVPVGVWVISYDDELNLDLYEGYPNLYMKDYLEFYYGEKKYIGMVYIMRPGHPVMEPTKWYENTIRTGYDEFGIEASPLDEAIENCKRERKQADKWNAYYSWDDQNYNYDYVKMGVTK